MTRTCWMWALSLNWIAFVASLSMLEATTLASQAEPASAKEPGGLEAPSGETQSPEQQLGGDDAEHSIKLRGLEERVNDLKERIFRSKARLVLLRETVLNNAIAGSKATIVHRNEMGSSFVLESVNYSMDGAPIYNRSDNGKDLDGKEEIELFNGPIVPGNHNLTVHLVYRGNGYGVFSYLKDYHFKVKSSYTFTAEEGKLTSIKVVGYEKGGVTADLKDRPSVRYDVDVKSEMNDPPVGSATKPKRTRATIAPNSPNSSDAQQPDSNGTEAK